MIFCLVVQMLIKETLNMDYSKFININRKQRNCTEYGEGIFGCSLHYYIYKVVE